MPFDKHYDNLLAPAVAIDWQRVRVEFAIQMQLQSLIECN